VGRGLGQVNKGRAACAERDSQGDDSEREAPQVEVPVMLHVAASVVSHQISWGGVLLQSARLAPPRVTSV